MQVATMAAITLLTGLSVWVVAGLPAGGRPTIQLAAAAAGQSRQSAEGVGAATSADTLVPNKCPVQATACVDTRLRLAWLQHDGAPFYGPVPIMPGTPGPDNAVATPVGIFHVQWKNAHQVSTEFNEPMPNAVFFAPGGIAFHEGSLVSSSHGCVHLSLAASAFFYAHLPRGAEVAVFRS
ncbi:MAG: L,D-transpeptidase [Sciscionella sp.]